MPNNPPAPEKPAGYVLVLTGNYERGDYVYLGEHEAWVKIPEALVGNPIMLFAARPPQPEPSGWEFSSKSEECRVLATLKETREMNRRLIEVLRKIILKAPAWGPLWYGSEEMKAARKIINPEESR